MKLSGKRLRVNHYPQLPCEPFTVEVKDEIEALLMINTLADQHIWLFKHNLIPDYCNSFSVEMYVENLNEWKDYFHNMMNWEDFEAVYENENICLND